MAGFGTIKRGDSGISFSRGRGAGKVSITVSFGDIAKWAKSNRAAMPAIVKKSHGTAANILRDQLRKVMRGGGGCYGVPAFKPYEPFTVELRQVIGKSGPIGGMLAERSSITRWKVGDRQFVGWTDGWKGDLADKFQAGEGGKKDSFADSSFRKMYHQMGISDVPHAYTHNRRDVMLTFQNHIDENLRTWRRHQLERNIAKELAKSRGWV